MSMHYRPSEELRELLTALADESLTEEQECRLGEILREDESAREHYLDYISLLTDLQWEFAEAAATSEPLPGLSHRKSQVPRWLWGWGLAASLLIGALLWLNRGSGDHSGETIATLIRCKGCRWSAPGSSPEEDARLAPGRLQLVAGLARIRFDSGAVVSVEAPADLEIRTARGCILNRGRMVTEVPESAIGFTVESPTAVIQDPGTEFGVVVSEEGTVEVSVFTGSVSVKHRSLGSLKQMKTGDNFRFTRNAVQAFEPDSTSHSSEVEEKSEVITLSTAHGRGADAYIESIAALRKRYRSTSLLLVKNSPWRRRGPQPRNRKAYLKFDIDSIKGAQILAADLKLTFAPSGIGFASQVPDATFAVYGLLDEKEDQWDEHITWETAPGNSKNGKPFWGGEELNEDKVALLGTFVIPQGEAQGTRSVGGTHLIELLKRDTNGIVTFILVRKTPGSGRNDLVHAFASRRHPDLLPPTLKVVVRPEAQP